MDFYNAKPRQATEANKQSLNALELAIRCLRDGRNAQAFALLSAARDNTEPAAAFALALCFLRAGEFPAAITLLEQALRLVRTLPFAPPAQAENSDTYKRLYRAQLETELYLSPMDADFCARFPKEAERTVLCALIHAHVSAGMDDEARRLSAGLAGSEFDLFKKRLMINQRLSI